MDTKLNKKEKGGWIWLLLWAILLGGGFIGGGFMGRWIGCGCNGNFEWYGALGAILGTFAGYGLMYLIVKIFK